MADRVVGDGWTERVFANPWTPITVDFPPAGTVVEVWWINTVLKATYDHTAHEWRSEAGTVLEGITHWRMIR